MGSFLKFFASVALSAIYFDRVANGICCGFIPFFNSINCTSQDTFINTRIDFCNSYGPCNIFCCNCDGRCREDGCDFELEHWNFVDLSYPETILSDEEVCEEEEICTLDIATNIDFEKRLLMDSDDWESAEVRTVWDSFKDEFGDQVADVIYAGVQYQCHISKGMKVQLIANPRVISLTSAVQFACNDGRIESSKTFTAIIPRVENGYMASPVFCKTLMPDGDVLYIEAERIS